MVYKFSNVTMIYAAMRPQNLTEQCLCKNFNNVPADQYHYGYLTMEDDVVRPYCDVTSITKFAPAHTSNLNLETRTTPTVGRRRSRWLSFVLVLRACHGETTSPHTSSSLSRSVTTENFLLLKEVSIVGTLGQSAQPIPMGWYGQESRRSSSASLAHEGSDIRSQELWNRENQWFH